MKKRVLSSAVLLLTACLWGISFVAQVIGARYMDTSMFNASRFLLGSFVMIPVFLLFERQKQDRQKILRTLMAALCGGSALFLASFAQQWGMGLTENPGKAGFITGIYNVLTPLFCLIFFRRRSGYSVWIGAGLAAVGLYLLCFDGTSGLQFDKGEILLLLGAVFWAFHIIVVDRFVERGVCMLKFACGQFFVCGMLNLAVAVATGTFSLQAVQRGIGPVLFCGIFAVAIGFTGQIIGQKLAGEPGRSAIFLSTESLFSVVGGVVWNLFPLPESYRVDADLNLYAILGCGIIFLAILVSQIPDKKAMPLRQNRE